MFLDYLRWICVADTSLAAHGLRFRPAFTTREAVLDHGARWSLRDACSCPPPLWEAPMAPTGTRRRPFAPGGKTTPTPAHASAGGVKKAASRSPSALRPEALEAPAPRGPKARGVRGPPKGASVAAGDPRRRCPTADRRAALDKWPRSRRSVAESRRAPDAAQPARVSLPPPPRGETVEDEIPRPRARLDQLLAAAPRRARAADARTGWPTGCARRGPTTPHAEAPPGVTTARATRREELLGREFTGASGARVATATGEVDEFGRSTRARRAVAAAVRLRLRPLVARPGRGWRTSPPAASRWWPTTRARCRTTGDAGGAAARRPRRGSSALRLAGIFIFHLPFAGTLLTRLGAVRACQEKRRAPPAPRRLRGEYFPEGVKGHLKLFPATATASSAPGRRAIKLAIRTRTPG